MEGVPDGSIDLSVVRSEPRAQKRPDLFVALHLDRVLTRKHHELPAAALADVADERGRSTRVAVMASLVGQAGDLSGEREVDDHPAFAFRKRLERSVEDRPYDGSPAVTADHIPSLAVDLPPAHAIRRPHADTVLVDDHLVDDVLESHIDALESVHVLPNDVVDIRLVPEIHPGVSVPALLAGGPRQEHPTIGAQEPEVTRDPCPLHDALREAQPLEESHRLIVDPSRPCPLEDVSVPLEHRD